MVSLLHNDRTLGHLGALRRLMARFPVVALLGARQVGKTTLSQSLARSTSGPVTRFDLEDPGAVGRHHHSRLLRQDVGCLRHAAAAALARESQQAPSARSEGLRAREAPYRHCG